MRGLRASVKIETFREKVENFIGIALEIISLKVENNSGKVENRN